MNICLMTIAAILITGSVRADNLTVAPTNPEALAFGRYIDSLHKRDPFTQSGPIGVVIEASLPGLRKESRIMAVRDIGESERSEYKVLESAGDAGVTKEVIAPYLAEQKQIEGLAFIFRDDHSGKL